MYVFQDGERMEYRCSGCGQDRLYGFGRAEDTTATAMLNCAICHKVTDHGYIGYRLPTASEAKQITEDINRYSRLMLGYDRS